VQIVTCENEVTAMDRCGWTVFVPSVCTLVYVCVRHCMYVCMISSIHYLTGVLQHACITWVGRWGETRATWRDLCFSTRSWL